MNGMHTLLLREKGTKDTPFFINIWPDSQRGPKENDYLLVEHYSKEGFVDSLNQLVKKLQKMAKILEKDTSKHKLVLKTDHVNENKQVFYSLELVDMEYEPEEDEQVVFFDNRIKGCKVDSVVGDLIAQLIRMGGITLTYSRSE